MTIFAPGSNVGFRVFGIAALAFGFITLALPDYYDQFQPPLTATDGRIFGYVACAAQIFGGAAIQFRRTEKLGAIVLGAVYLAISLLSVPPIVATPRVFAPWGDFFEQFALLTGAALAYARMRPDWAPKTLERIGRILWGTCTISFMLFQALYPEPTAVLVPKWLPPSQMFWAIATTVFFGLAAVAFLINRFALLAARLLTLMVVLFGIIVWLPLLIADPRNHTNWTETVLNFAIAGAGWIVADLLGERGPAVRSGLIAGGRQRLKD